MANIIITNYQEKYLENIVQ